MLGPFAKRFRVLAFDHRGMGESDVPDAAYSMSNLADDAIALVDEVGWTRFRVFGISFGGMVAQHVGARVPDRIDRMVLACTSSGGAGGSSYPLHELYALPDDVRAERFPAILDTRFTPEFVANDEMARLLLSAPRPTLAGETKRGLDLQMNARRHHDAFDLLPSITCPVMVAAGATDGIAPPENCRRLAERLPAATYREFTGGHMFMLQDRSATPAMIDFLAG
ncbi:MAG: alpha/beta hydrolase [Acidimicrobiales bacterium mtb01]|nr:alpha/beta fold hydrolase [Actinomycetota bacterium]TEX46034.1 MAG: alpha/beta hydrolase [Acidimicrobiales bacterium mtb01]